MSMNTMTVRTNEKLDSDRFLNEIVLTTYKAQIYCIDACIFKTGHLVVSQAEKLCAITNLFAVSTSCCCEDD